MNPFFAFVDRIPRNYRYLISLLISLAVFAATWFHSTSEFTFLVSWICFCVCVLFFTWTTILLKHPKQISVVASEQDSSYVMIFGFVVAAAFVSIFGIILLLHSLSNSSQPRLDIHIILAVVAVGLSWILIHTLFTIRYAHLYYDFPTGVEKNNSQHPKGLLFPDTEYPDFLDFAYYSFVLGMTFQTADVNIAGRTFRHLALLHGFLSFVYNTTIIALSINIISGLIGK